MEGPSAPDRYHHTGLMLQARFSQTITQTTPIEAALPIYGVPGMTPPMIAIGYRGAGYSVSLGPMFWTYGPEKDRNAQGFGASVLVEASLGWSASRRAESYLLLGGTAGGVSIEGSDNGGAVGGGLIGFGARYWLAPGLGLGAEIGESLVSFPEHIGDKDRAVAAATFGTMGLTVVAE